MACYTEKASLTATDPKWKSSGKLTQELITCMKKHAQNFGIDWKWLAALSNAESTWNIRNPINKKGYGGLFSYNESYMSSGHNNVFSYDDQTYCAAKDMKRRLKDAKDKYNMTGEEAYLYACIAHNMGDGGVKSVMKDTQPKTIQSLINTMKKKNKPIENIRHPLHCKTAYDYVVKNYK